jgi:tetrapyrrole methylase family protein/MazG family protein
VSTSDNLDPRIEWDLALVGLGPSSLDFMTRRALQIVDLVEQGKIRGFVRTRSHPASRELLEKLGGSLTCFDPLYARFDDYDALYSEMARRVVDAAVSVRDSHSSLQAVAYFVPGSPLVAEDSCLRALELAKAAGLAVEVVPGVSFVEAVMAAVGADALAEPSLQVVDAYRIEEAVLGEGAMVVAQCHSVQLLSSIKLALIDDVGPDHRVALVDAAGTPAERVLWVELSEIDKCGFEPGNLTSVFVPASERAPGRALRNFVDLVERLRGPGGCPWDAAQTHHSLGRHLLEETYEVLEALESLPPEAPGGEPDYGAYARLEEELGDLLFQIAFHATLAKEAGAFTIADVARGIHEKLVARHPHVFGEAKVSGPAEVASNWEVLKAKEKQRESLMDDIPTSLPALLLAHKIQRRASSVGFDWNDADGVIAKVQEEFAELETELRRARSAQGSVRGSGAESGHLSEGTRAGSRSDTSGGETGERWAVAPPGLVDEFGDLLFSLVNLARHLRIDPEQALRKACRRFAQRFKYMEKTAAAEGKSLAELSESELEELWERAK